MANLGGLPNLNNRRLSVLQKQLNASRKSITIVNDKLKESLERLEKSVDRRKQSDSFRSWQKSVPVKKDLVEINALKKCLRRRRESTTLEPETTPRNGVYDGATLDSMKTDVNNLISERAPRERRMRKVEEMKSVGYRDGMLVDYKDTLNKLQNVLSRPKGKAARSPFGLSPRRTVLVRERPLHDDYFRSEASSCDETSESEADDVVSSSMKPPRSASADEARTRLQLPPIQAAKRQSQYERSLPSYRKNRGTELPNLVRRVSSFGPY